MRAIWKGPVHETDRSGTLSAAKKPMAAPSLAEPPEQLICTWPCRKVTVAGKSSSSLLVAELLEGIMISSTDFLRQR